MWQFWQFFLRRVLPVIKVVVGRSDPKQTRLGYETLGVSVRPHGSNESGCACAIGTV